ncbi:hypothetical protein SDRG_14897 [Saprolegnia diclina VS20]|uniref:Uncharacterized protein n=1 Tax=Saprolegnia diclina (strain VS20) TaxID=1156394 RepID=T0PYF8_SAPDV|nr:hypothetical protein SDRG_14897 [Saprolegnia diclina VS20]EQC27276.1 hypothetical protein SDRG_14897 [Saprolegnia diclina VS20]|eukprot:XP_008619279.1 hypothetical protein SDRG_14897 [Saprolegnia diclina VS20]
MVLATIATFEAEAPSETTNRRRRHRRPLSLEQKELCRQRSRVYYMEHKDRVLAKSKARYEFNRDEERARRREIYALKKGAKKKQPSATVVETPVKSSIQFLLN